MIIRRWASFISPTTAATLPTTRLSCAVFMVISTASSCYKTRAKTWGAALGEFYNPRAAVS